MTFLEIKTEFERLYEKPYKQWILYSISIGIGCLHIARIARNSSDLSSIIHGSILQLGTLSTVPIIAIGIIWDKIVSRNSAPQTEREFLEFWLKRLNIRVYSSYALVFMLFFTIISLVAYFTFTAKNDYEVPLQPAGLYQIMMWCVVGLCIVMGLDRKSTRLNSSHLDLSRMPSSA